MFEEGNVNFGKGSFKIWCTNKKWVKNKNGNSNGSGVEIVQ
jgi:hypothetical protein